MDKNTVQKLKAFFAANPFKVPIKPWTVKDPALQPGQQEYTIREV